MIATAKEIQTVDSILLSEYILSKYGPMSHLKLQKLLFYSQAYHLAYFDAPLIEDDFEAWVHGPVSRKVFSSLNGKSNLHTEIKYAVEPGKAAPDASLENMLTKEQHQLLEETLSELSGFTGMELENLTHSEAPWQLARKGVGPADPCNKLIPKEQMQEFYKNQLYA